MRTAARRLAGTAFAIVIAGVVAGCAQPPSRPTGPPMTRSAAATGPGTATPAGGATSGTSGSPDRPALLGLIGTPGAMHLGWLDEVSFTPLPTPPDTRWVAGRPSRGLVATVGADGRIFAADPFAPGGRPDWHAIPLDAAARRWLGVPPSVTVPDPNSQLIAAVATDPGSGSLETHLVVVDPAGGPARIVAVPGTWDGRAPAWLGPGRIVVSTRDRTDRVGLVLVDLATARTRRLGDGVSAYAVSGDGSTIAWQERDDGRVVAGPAGQALAGAPLDPVPIEGRAPVAAQLLLDATGGRLAIAWLDEAGDTTAYAVYDRGTGDWAPERAGTLPGEATRLVLVSLDP